MYKKTWAALFISSSILTSPLFASNFFQKFMPLHASKHANSALKSHSGLKAQKGTEDFTDFSGT